MPTVDNSRRPSLEGKLFPYVNSSPQQDAWGQPPASYFSFEVVGKRLEGQLIGGVYLSSTSSNVWDVDDIDIKIEMSQWEALGIENLNDFESSIEE